MITTLLLLTYLIQADPSYVVSGTVVNRVDSKPLNNATVFLNGSGHDSVVTGRDGAFRFEGVPKGKFQLMAERTGFSRQGYRARSIATNLSTAVVTGEGQKTEGLTFGLIPGAVLTGMLSDTLGNPVTGMRITVHRVVGVGGERRLFINFWGATTDDRGFFRLSGMPAGSYVITAMGWTQGSPVPTSTPSGYPVTYYPGTPLADRAAQIRLDAGKEARADFVLTPMPVVNLSGTVALTEFPSGGYVMLAAPGPFGRDIDIVRIPLGQAQRFALQGVVQGRYVMRVQDSQNRLKARSELNVGASETDIVLGETPFARVAIHVDVRGTPRPSQNPLTVRIASSSVQGARNLDSSGNAVFEALAPGQYEVSIAKGAQLPIVSITAKGAKQVGGTLDIPETGSVEVSIMADASLGRNVRGIAFRGDQPEGGLLAVLVPAKNWENTGAYRFDQSDSDGSFTWPTVAPGDYIAFAFEDGEPADYTIEGVIRSLASKGQKVTITADPNQTVAIHLARQ